MGRTCAVTWTCTHTFAGFELYHTWREASTLWCNSSQPKGHPKNYSKKTCSFPSFLHQRIRISPGWRQHKVRVFGKGGNLEKWPREEYWFCCFAGRRRIITPCSFVLKKWENSFCCLLQIFRAQIFSAAAFDVVATFLYPVQLSQ